MEGLDRRHVLAAAASGLLTSTGCVGGLSTTAACADEVAFEPQRLQAGAGVFSTRGGQGHEADRIKVHYYRPENLTPESRVLLVIPGDGRNGDDYRNAWVGAADNYGLLIAALEYSEANYDFAAYQMGGVVKNLEVSNAPLDADGDLPDVVWLRDEDISFDINPHPSAWMFRDFDRIFDLMTRATGVTTNTYDLFGHSAGGQILHRAVIFNPRSRADRVIAANAGFYTLPDLQTPPLVGVKGSGIAAAELTKAFQMELHLMLGELDNGDDAGGSTVHTPIIDQQGIGRLNRGRHFFDTSRRIAGEMSAPFNWRLQVVPKVGHDQRAMAQSAASVLYG